MSAHPTPRLRHLYTRCALISNEFQLAPAFSRGSCFRSVNVIEVYDDANNGGVGVADGDVGLIRSEGFAESLQAGAERAGSY
jgi:hypothetical protein